MSRKLNFKETMLISKILSDIELKKMNIDYTQDKQKVALDILSFIISNVHLAEDTLSELLTVYGGKNIDELDIDDVVDVITDICKNGLPKILNKMFDVEDLKKKLMENEN